MQLAAGQIIAVFHPSDVGAARRAAKAAAQHLGFPQQACEEIALAMTELATNLLKHAGAGRLLLTPLESGGRAGLEIESRDEGPGIANVQDALTDGFSTAGSRGTGLGAVNRLMDELEIDSPPGGGTRIVCRKWLKPAPVSVRRCPLAFGVLSRPKVGCMENGDTFVLHHWKESVLVGVIDGLGHGPAARRAAQAARNYVEAHFDLPLARLFAGVGRACQGTRGVVMALMRFDWGRGTFAFGSIGNVEARVLASAARISLPNRRGILGLHAPEPVIAEGLWAEGNLLVLHSDGLRTHWSWADFPGLAGQSANSIAQQLLQALAKEEDDATVLVARRALP